MHLSEGIATGPALLAGAAACVIGVAAGLRAMDIDKTPRTAMLAAVLFVASLIRAPFGPASVHLVLNGLAGILLGWTVFPAFAVALLMQALIFQFGGLTVLGLNTCIMAFPALAAYYAFQFARGARPATAALLAGGLGALTALCSGLMLAAVLMLGGRGFGGVAVGLLAAHLPVMITDGLVTCAAVGFLIKTRPDLLWPARNKAEA